MRIRQHLRRSNVRHTGPDGVPPRRKTQLHKGDGSLHGEGSLLSERTGPFGTREGLQEALHKTLDSRGEALPDHVRAVVEPRFCVDFGRVRIHADAAAAEVARRLSARAFTLGRDIVFGRGEYEPRISPLLAHELAHVVQQQGGETSPPLGLTESEASQEWAADAAARTVLEGRRPEPLGRAAVRIARQPTPVATMEPEEDVTPPVDAMAGAVVTEIVIGQGNGRVAFRTSRGVILGTGHTDLEPGAYGIKPNFKEQIWIITKRGIPVGERFVVDLEGATPWTLSYPGNLTLTVSAGPLLTEEEAKQEEAAEAQKQAELRREVTAVDPMQVRELWAEKKDAFVKVASDPANTLGGRQLYQIWLRLWMERQAKAHAELEAVEARLKAEAEAQGGDALVLFLDNKMLFGKGKRDALGPEYRAAAEQRETVDFMISELRGVVDWLESWVDGAGNHVTLQQVNAKALEIAKAKAWFRMYMAPIILGAMALGAHPRGGAPPGRAAATVVEEPAVKVEAAEPESLPEQGKSGSVTPIEQAHRIRARRAAAAAEAPQEVERQLASGDRPRASSDGGKGARSTTQELELRRWTESSGGSETRLPPEEPAVQVEARARGNAIERAHLDSMPEYSRPGEHNFPGIDAWKSPETDSTRTLPNGMRVRIISRADVLQVKSVGSSKPRAIAANVRAGVAGLDSDRYVNSSGTVRVVKPRSRTLDIIFEEGAMKEVTAETRQLLREHSAEAGERGVRIRWYRYVAGKKVVISTD